MVFFINEQYLGLVGDNMSLEKKIKQKDKRIEELEELLKECRFYIENITASANSNHLQDQRLFALDEGLRLLENLGRVLK